MNKSIVRVVVASGLISLMSAGAFASPESEATAADASQKVKLVFFTSVNVDTEGQTVNDNPYVKYIRERNNVDLELISESQQYNQKLNAIMASGDLPDYLLVPQSGGLLDALARDGMIIPLDSYISKAPNLQKGIDKISWDLSSVDGKIYAVPFQRYDKTPYLVYCRKDFVDNLKIDLSKVNTIDEYYAMLRRFVTDDPDRNGAADTYGIVGRQANFPSWGMLFFDAFDAARYKVVDGELRPNYILKEYRDWLAFNRRLYQEKILEPEYLLNSTQKSLEKFGSGKYGTYGTFWSLQTVLVPRESVVPLKPAARRDGQESRYLYPAPIRHYIAVTKQAKNPERVVSILNWALSDEGGTFIHAGVEGLDYDLVNSKVVIKPNRRGKNWAWRFITLGVQKSKMDPQLSDLLEQSWGKVGLEHLAFTDRWGDYDQLAMFAPNFRQLADYSLTPMVEEFRDKAILGKVNLDTEWDNYVAAWRKSGGDVWIKLHTEWYKARYKK